jgi:RNA methyltransferase, TrmH family
MQQICSKDNPKFKAVRALLRSKKQREQSARFVMEGVRALSALADGTALPHYRLRELWISDKADEASLPCLQEKEVSLFRISHAAMEQLSDCCTSQGLLGVVEHTPVPLQIDPEQGSYLLLDGLTDPGNMGTLIRSSVAFGFDGIFLRGDCVELYNPKTVRAAMGALPFCRHWKTGDDLFRRLEELDYELISTRLRGGEDLYEMAFGPRNVLVIGNEAHGVSDAVYQHAQRHLTIPMSGNAESLNAGVAGSICMSAIKNRR